MFAYCGNNPVNRLDLRGLFWCELREWLEKVWNGIKETASDIFGAGCTTSVTLYESETPIIPDPAPITIHKGTNVTETVSSHGDSSKIISVYADGSLDNPIDSSSAGIYVNAKNLTLDIGVALDDIGIKGSINQGNTTTSLAIKLNLSRLKIGLEYSTAESVGGITSTSYTNASVNGWFIVAVCVLVISGQEAPYPPAIPSPA